MDITIQDAIQAVEESRTLEHPMVNELGSYTDIYGITHIRVIDENKEYELVDGAWIEKAPF